MDQNGPKWMEMDGFLAILVEFLYLKVTSIFNYL